MLIEKRNIERRNVSFELRAANEDGSEFEGYANCFHTIDCYQSIMAPGAFTASLGEFLRTGFIGGINHDWDQPIGKPLEAREEAKGLFTKGHISPTSHGLDVRVLIKEKVIQKLSIGFIVTGRQWLENADEVTAYWQSHNYTPTADDIANSQYGARLMTAVRLFEYSPVTLAGTPGSDITNVRSGERASLRLDDHLLSVLAADEELLQRLRDLSEKRQADGRQLSSERLSQLKRLRDGYDTMLRKAETSDITADREIPTSVPHGALVLDKAARETLAQKLQHEMDLLTL